MLCAAETSQTMHDEEDRLLGAPSTPTTGRGHLKKQTLAAIVLGCMIAGVMVVGVGSAYNSNKTNQQMTAQLLWEYPDVSMPSTDDISDATSSLGDVVQDAVDNMTSTVSENTTAKAVVQKLVTEAAVSKNLEKIEKKANESVGEYTEEYTEAAEVLKTLKDDERVRSLADGFNKAAIKVFQDKDLYEKIAAGMGVSSLETTAGSGGLGEAEDSQVRQADVLTAAELVLADVARRVHHEAADLVKANEENITSLYKDLREARKESGSELFVDGDGDSAQYVAVCAGPVLGFFEPAACLYLPSINLLPELCRFTIEISGTPHTWDGVGYGGSVKFGWLTQPTPSLLAGWGTGVSAGGDVDISALVSVGGKGGVSISVPSGQMVDVNVEINLGVQVMDLSGPEVDLPGLAWGYQPEAPEGDDTRCSGAVLPSTDDISDATSSLGDFVQDAVDNMTSTVSENTTAKGAAARVLGSASGVGWFLRASGVGWFLSVRLRIV